MSREEDLIRQSFEILLVRDDQGQQVVMLTVTVYADVILRRASRCRFFAVEMIETSYNVFIGEQSGLDTSQ